MTFSNDDIIVRYEALPYRVKGLTVLDEYGNYNIYLNNRLTMESNNKTLIHELNHIKNNDFVSNKYIAEIENN